MGNSVFFHDRQQILRQTANSAVWHENLHAVEYCWPWLITNTITHTIRCQVVAHKMTCK